MLIEQSKFMLDIKAVLPFAILHINVSGHDVVYGFNHTINTNEQSE